MLPRQSGNPICVADVPSVRQYENGMCALPDHGAELSLIVVEIEEFLDADAALLRFTPKLPHAEICSFRAGKCNMGNVWCCLQQEIELFAVKVRAKVDRDACNIARR